MVDRVFVVGENLGMKGNIIKTYIQYTGRVNKDFNTVIKN